jgi:hypothetical protein
MIFVPISLGELVDKITILKIKLLKIKDKLKLDNVIKEYNILLDIMVKNNIKETDDFFIKLYEINLDFWNYHDWQREKWAGYDENIIDVELYRKNKNEHILNDKRAKIKKQINLLYNSEIIEEKQFISYTI